MSDPGEQTQARAEKGPVRSGLCLVVDDNQVNRDLLQAILEHRGYKTLVAASGREALAAAASQQPDLILLDVMMPDLDGFAVCAALKQDPATADIPVIFVTAKVETQDIVKGFAMGAVDYITKPVKMAEVLARVDTRLRLQRLEAERTQALECKLKSDHWQAVKTIVEGLAHNFNNLLAAAMGNLQYLQKFLPDPDLKEAADDGLDSLERAKRLVQLILQYHDLKFDNRPTNLQKLLDETVEYLEQTLEPGIKIVVELAEPLPLLAPGLRPYLAQALESVLKNAREAMADTGEIKLSAQVTVDDRKGERRVKIVVRDTGRGLSPETLAKAFLPFFSTKNTVGVGLGLYVAKISLEQVGGTLELTGEPGQGAEATLTVPI